MPTVIQSHPTPHIRWSPRTHESVCSPMRARTGQIRLVDQPTHEQLQAWWQAMHKAPQDLVYMVSDTSAKTLAAFRKRVHRGEYAHHCLFMEGDTIAAAFWLHDLIRDTRHQVCAGWLASWVAPSYRGLQGVFMWSMARAYLEQMGVKSLFAAIQIENRKARISCCHVMRFHRVGIIQNFRCDQAGQPIDAAIYTMHAHDEALTWQEALKRAAKAKVTAKAKVA